MILFLLACATNTCPAEDKRFVPVEDPADVFEWENDHGLCEGEWVSNASLSAYKLVSCDCASWCDARYLGGVYCVKDGDVEAWAARDCPSCGYYYGANAGPAAVYVSCTGCDK